MNALHCVLLRSVLEILLVGNLRGQGGSVSRLEVASCTFVFLGGHFLFTCSETFAVDSNGLATCSAPQTGDVLL